ncbi:MAG: glycosyltransferase [Bacteroidales bacterium]
MDKTARKYFERLGLPDKNIKLGSIKNKDIFVAIPCHNEADIYKTIDSLSASQRFCNTKVQVVVAVNSHYEAPNHIIEQNKRTLEYLNSLENSSNFACHAINISIDNKKEAGPGLARKVAMDSIVFQVCLQGKDVVICSLDADCQVSANYFAEINTFFTDKNNFASTIYFEHQLDELQSAKQKEGAMLYELYMRYFFHASKHYGLPHPMYTVGSCFALRSSSYLKVGGMNKRIAGEDFYFLHSLTRLGKAGSINKTTIYPSARTSDRVLFGTGPSIKNWMNGDETMLTSYPLLSFEALGKFWNIAEQLYSKNITEVEHTLEIHALEVLRFIRKNNKKLSKLVSISNSCTSTDGFIRRLPTFFTALDQQRFLRDYKNCSAPQNLMCEAKKLLELMGQTKRLEDVAVLGAYRELDRGV